MWGGPNPSRDPASPRWSLRSGRSSWLSSTPSTCVPNRALLPETAPPRNTPLNGNGISAGIPRRVRADAPRFVAQGHWWLRCTELVTGMPGCKRRRYRGACGNDRLSPSTANQTTLGANERRVLRSQRSLRKVPGCCPRLAQIGYAEAGSGREPTRTDPPSPSAAPPRPSASVAPPARSSPSPP